MARIDPQFNLRIPADLKGRIEAAAAENGRSATQEILTRLQASFEPPPEPRDNPRDLQRILDRLDRQRQDLEDARLRVFSEAFVKLRDKALAEGLSMDEAWNRAYLEAHHVAYPG